jgi:hypothetical protein
MARPEKAQVNFQNRLHCKFTRRNKITEEFAKNAVFDFGYSNGKKFFNAIGDRAIATRGVKKAAGRPAALLRFNEMGG